MSAALAQSAMTQNKPRTEAEASLGKDEIYTAGICKISHSIPSHVYHGTIAFPALTLPHLQVSAVSLLRKHVWVRAPWFAPHLQTDL